MESHKLTKDIVPYPEQKVVVEKKGHSTTTLVLTSVSVSVIVALICVVAFLLYEMNDLKKTRAVAVPVAPSAQYVQPPVQYVPESYRSYHRPVIHDRDRDINMSSPISGNVPVVKKRHTKSYPVVPPNTVQENISSQPVMPYHQTYDTPPGVDLPDRPQDIP